MDCAGLGALAVIVKQAREYQCAFKLVAPDHIRVLLEVTNLDLVHRGALQPGRGNAGLRSAGGVDAKLGGTAEAVPSELVLKEPGFIRAALAAVLGGHGFSRAVNDPTPLSFRIPTSAG